MAEASRRRSGSAEAPRVAVVLSGAGARGAFQAGALAELVPELEAKGAFPTVWLGTSAGSINAALWGSYAHLGAEEAARETLAVWRRMGNADVYAPLLPFSLPRTALRYAAGAVLGRGPGTTSLLDTTPLRRTARDELDTEQLSRNVEEGLLDAVGVVATRVPGDADSAVPGAASGRSVLFLHEHTRSAYDGDPDRALGVARGRLDPDHVVASSAIPVAFPPTQLLHPPEVAGWYIDGGVRLNTPLQPAVALGATKLVVVSATATTYAPPPAPAPGTPGPDVADAAAEVLNAALADRTTEDLLALRRTNRLVAQAATLGGAGLLTGSSGRPYRHIELMTVSPPSGEMGQVAADVFARRTGGIRRITENDNWLVGQALRGLGDGAGRRELLSYLLFDQEYFAAGIELGRAAARAALATGWES